MGIPSNRVTIFALTLLYAISAANFAFAEVFKPTRFVLDNGLELVVIEDHRRPVVAHFIYYRVGSMDEDPGKTGLAHFLEHLMFKGTANIEAGAFPALSRNMVAVTTLLPPKITLLISRWFPLTSLGR